MENLKNARTFPINLKSFLYALCFSFCPQQATTWACIFVLILERQIYHKIAHICIAHQFRYSQSYNPVRRKAQWSVLQVLLSKYWNRYEGWIRKLQTFAPCLLWRYAEESSWNNITEFNASSMLWAARANVSEIYGTFRYYNVVYTCDTWTARMSEDDIF